MYTDDDLRDRIHQILAATTNPDTMDPDTPRNTRLITIRAIQQKLRQPNATADVIHRRLIDLAKLRYALMDHHPSRTGRIVHQWRITHQGLANTPTRDVAQDVRHRTSRERAQRTELQRLCGKLSPYSTPALIQVILARNVGSRETLAAALVAKHPSLPDLSIHQLQEALRLRGVPTNPWPRTPITP